MNELKRCPFCGGEAELLYINNSDPVIVYCEKCGLEFGLEKYFKTYEAIEAWNRRAIEALTEKEASANARVFKLSHLIVDSCGGDSTVFDYFAEPRIHRMIEAAYRMGRDGVEGKDVFIDIPPYAEPQITLESAVDFLHSIGWMQEHDRILTAAAQRRGKWIPKDERWHCTLCDGIAPKGIRWKFCPICGARMEGTERQRAAEGNAAGSKREET